MCEREGPGRTGRDRMAATSSRGRRSRGLHAGRHILAERRSRPASVGSGAAAVQALECNAGEGDDCHRRTSGAPPAPEGEAVNWLRQFADWRPFASLRTRPPGEKRFLVLVPLTGAATGFAAIALIRLLGLVQGGFWGPRHELLEHALQLPVGG